MILRTATLLAIILICGCVNQAPTCNAPYILVGLGCCLDENSDGICDSDKPVTTTAAPTTSTTSTSTTTSTASTSTSTTVPIPAGEQYSNYSNIAYDVSLKVPITWGMTEGAGEGVIVALYSPQDSRFERGAAQVTVKSGRYVITPTLATFKSDVLSERRRAGIWYLQTSVTDSRVDGKPAFRHIYEFKHGDVKLTGAEYVVYTGGHMYSIIFEAVPELYDAYLPVFENVTSSFRIGGI